MTLKGLSILYFGSFVPVLSFDNSTICNNKKTGENKCCTDYRNVSGSCEPCIGSWGNDCAYSCEFGFYGHGCREKCNCSKNQVCIPTSGCVEISDTEEILVPKQSGFGNVLNIEIIIIGVGGVIFLSLTGAVLFVQLKLKQNRTTGKITESVASGNSCTFQREQTEYIYDDVRESQMIENIDIRLSGRNGFLRNNPVFNKQMKHCRSLPRQHHNQWRDQLTRSRTLTPQHYGRHNITSDNYNHLDFDKNSNDDDRVFNDEEEDNAFTVHRSDILKSNNNCRPYSSVKYNRKVDTE
ncbi:uncharacterized protein LOC125647748 isoform X2 [Ostrea edulis]|uniref:uncharacterized protein LOC125647748 isoform X2 n=1 Tax=Ostrea edulis TaxID=37623 RepID=UPI0024AFE625|nr:uncharacterized protein LOC125647748 isoform X2 [Ostrea edulis]